MNQTETVRGHLTAFVQLLESEREALLENRGERVATIVEEKQTFLHTMAAVDLKTVDSSILKPLIETIRQLQETNLILTKQTLHYHKVVLDALGEGKKTGKTYSKQGTPTSSSQANLLNQSF